VPGEMEGVAGATTGGDAEDPPHPVITASKRVLKRQKC
jgi:hypothetical protein